MVKGLYTAYTGMVEEMRRMDVMTNNLAGRCKPGRKGRRNLQGLWPGFFLRDG